MGTEMSFGCSVPHAACAIFSFCCSLLSPLSTSPPPLFSLLVLLVGSLCMLARVSSCMSAAVLTCYSFDSSPSLRGCALTSQQVMRSMIRYRCVCVCDALSRLSPSLWVRFMRTQVSVWRTFACVGVCAPSFPLSSWLGGFRLLFFAFGFVVVRSSSDVHNVHRSMLHRPVNQRMDTHPNSIDPALLLSHIFITVVIIIIIR